MPENPLAIGAMQGPDQVAFAFVGEDDEIRFFSVYGPEYNLKWNPHLDLNTHLKLVDSKMFLDHLPDFFLTLPFDLLYVGVNTKVRGKVRAHRSYCIDIPGVDDIEEYYFSLQASHQCYGTVYGHN